MLPLVCNGLKREVDMMNVYLMKYDYRGDWSNMNPDMHILAESHDEAMAIANDICGDRGYDFKSLSFVGEWVNMNRVDIG